MSRRLSAIYHKLYSFFGPQHWWPADEPFEVIVGSILTQNTSWQNVEKAIVNLKKRRVLTARKLYKLPKETLASLIRPAGYYNIKSKRLKEFLRFLFENYQGDIKRLSLADTGFLRQQLLSVNGIGPETADSILLYALGKPIFVVDAYTKRILLRHRFVRENAGYTEIQNLFMQNPALSKKKRLQSRKGGVKLFNEYHALLVRLGKEFCLKNKPKCDTCPLK